MQITIGEYTTRNGCRAIVGENNGELFIGTVTLPGSMSIARAWWDFDGHIRFPNGEWFIDYLNGGRMVFKSPAIATTLWYSKSTYAMLTAIPSPFDITEPKQMKEETKPVLVQKQRLIKLPDGSWVDPTTVAAITIIQPSVLDPESLRYWIAVIRTSVTEININCDSREQAQNLADDLAEKVNLIK